MKEYMFQNEQASSLNSKINAPFCEIQGKNRLSCIYTQRVIDKECILCLGNETDAEPGETQAQKQRMKLAILN